MPHANDSLPSSDRRLKPRKRALIVDGNVLSRIETRLLLEMHGYQVEEVSDGMEAIGLLDVEAPKLDLVVLDLDMPLLSGTETLHSLRALQPGLRALLCGEEAEALKGQPLPEKTAFIHKPCTMHGLSMGLDKVFGVERHILGHGKVAHTHWVKVLGQLPHYPPR